MNKMTAAVKKRACELFAALICPKMSEGKVSTYFQEMVKDYSDVFVDEVPNELPPRIELDFEINLKSDQQPPVRPVIRLSHEELKRQLQVFLTMV